MSDLELAHQYTIGNLTYEKVFKAAGLTNLSDMQVVLDAFEVALSRHAEPAMQPVAYADPQALANFEVARKNGYTSGPYCSEWMHAHQWRGEISLFAAPQPEQSGLMEAAKEAVEYLDANKLNQISSGSILHVKLSAALSATPSSETDK